MRDQPPKHSPDASPYESAESGSGLVAMYTAASHANAESFPVLKAFQDYIEAERTQARKRVVQLSVLFAVLMGVVVTGFLTAGIFMLRNMSEVQTKLLDVALASRESPAPQPAAAPAPVAAQSAPLVEESIRQMTQAASQLQSSLDKRMDGFSDIATKVHDRVAAQDSELGKLRSELKNMRAQSERLKDELGAIKTEAKTAAPAAVRAGVGAGSSGTASGVPAAEPAKPLQVVAAGPVGTHQGVQTEPAKPLQVVAAGASGALSGVQKKAEQPQVADPRFPPAVKMPPTSQDGVTPPPVPHGRLATAIPLKAKNIGTIPWRVLIPD